MGFESNKVCWQLKRSLIKCLVGWSVFVGARASLIRPSPGRCLNQMARRPSDHPSWHKAFIRRTHAHRRTYSCAGLWATMCSQHIVHHNVMCASLSSKVEDFLSPGDGTKIRMTWTGFNLDWKWLCFVKSRYSRDRICLCCDCKQQALH